MNWLLIGMLLGSLVTSSHETEEGCLGRRDVLQKKGVEAQCVQKTPVFSYTTGTISPYTYLTVPSGSTGCR